MTAQIVQWGDPKTAWSESELTVVTSTWDYHESQADFLAWTRSVSEKTSLWNPSELIAWNSNKSYLLDLQHHGIPVPPTARIQKGARVDLSRLVHAHEWQRFVVKPSVGANSAHLWQGNGEFPAQAQAHLDQLLQTGDALVQPFIPSLAKEGELSVIMFDGEYSHAVQKIPARGDYRANPVMGARVEPAQPGQEALELAQAALAAAPHQPLYARVDIVTMPDDELAIMELELIEPLLYLSKAPGSETRFAAAIRRRLKQ